MSGMSETIIVGNLGRDPETRQTQSGKAVMNFPVAVTEKRSGNEYTTWFDVTVWERQAEGLAKCDFGKGSKVLVKGRVKVRQFEKRNGEPGAALELTAFNVLLLGGGGGGSGGQRGGGPDDYGTGSNAYGSSGTGGGDMPSDDFGDDDIPF